jgi:hypothetical protein
VMALRASRVHAAEARVARTPMMVVMMLRIVEGSCCCRAAFLYKWATTQILVVQTSCIYGHITEDGASFRPIGIENDVEITLFGS